jgi:hypothetical protein
MRHNLECNLASGHFSELFFIFREYLFQTNKNINQRKKLQALQYQKIQSHLLVEITPKREANWTDHQINP